MDGNDLARVFLGVRHSTERLTRSLGAEDQMVQSMPLASPTKWHLAHTAWFFETFVVRPHDPEHRPLFPEVDRLFNSYYEAVGHPPDRTRRGMMSRPTLDEVRVYRRAMDEAVLRLLRSSPRPEVLTLVELGINHEEQHQELILTDILHAFSLNPLEPAYLPAENHAPGAVAAAASAAAGPPTFSSFAGGLTRLGHGGTGFAFDNEGPAHDRFVLPFALADRLVTCGEYQVFVEDGCYLRPELWLSDGWDASRRGGWQMPLYWRRRENRLWHFSLCGLEPLRPEAPVANLSFFEAEAYARWAGCRLPHEWEWEIAARRTEVRGNLLESGHLGARPAPAGASAPAQLYGDLWEWTQSPYAPYPGYRQPAGAMGEYNGKFMCNQLVLRGGSCATPKRHIRATYRNFFPPEVRWQFSGIRLAKDVDT